jgi:AraC-like DNA-binding protein
MLDRSSAQSPQEPPPADALSEVLEDFRLVGVSYGRCELRHPWSLSFPEQGLLRFHFVSRGPCWLFTDGDGWLQLNDGDLVLLPQGVAHRLASTPDVECQSLEGCKVNNLGGNVCGVVKDGGGEATTLFHGSMAPGSRALHPLLTLMPAIVRGCDVASNDPIVRPLLEAMTAEAAEPRMGSATILSRMADLLTARLIRCWVDCSENSTSGWLAAIRDPHIGRALGAIHRDPGGDWTVERLAREAGQSRSVFAERFSALLGEGAGHYLTRWRMQLANEWLRERGSGISEVARKLGYDSEASFGRAYKRVTGQSPGAQKKVGSGRTVMPFGLLATDRPTT